MTIDDFESYDTDADIQAAWPHNIEGIDYILLGIDSTGNKSMRFYYQNQYEPFFTEATRTFDGAQDWTRLGIETLSLSFVGETDNVEQRMYLKVEDAAGNSTIIEYPDPRDLQSWVWHDWTVPLSEIASGGVDLTQVSKFVIGFGDGTNSGQVGEDMDLIVIDNIKLFPAR